MENAGAASEVQNFKTRAEERKFQSLTDSLMAVDVLCFMAMAMPLSSPKHAVVASIVGQLPNSLLPEYLYRDHYVRAGSAVI